MSCSIPRSAVPLLLAALAACGGSGTPSQGTAATPIFSPAAGTYSTAQDVAISSATASAVIHYTVDGSTPTRNSPTYSSPLHVSATETLMALATAAGDADSAVASAAYTISAGTSAAAAPTFSPQAGIYTTAQSVTISSSTGGAAIYYTTDGSVPTTGSTHYTAPVQVNASETLTAIAAATGYSNSAPAAAAYTITSGNNNGVKLLVDGLTQVRSLTLVGGNLYWVDGANSADRAIKSVPIGGGTAKVVYANSALLGDLASDGANLYFTATNPSAFTDIDSVALDGTGLKSLATGVYLVSGTNDASGIFVQGGNLYGLGTLSSVVFSMPVPAGGAPATVSAGASGQVIQTLFGVDSSGVYFGYYSTSSGAQSVAFAPLAGGGGQTLMTPAAYPWRGVVAPVGGTAYALVMPPSPSEALFWKSPSPSGPGVNLTTYAGQDGQRIAGDAAGLYALIRGANAGVYRLDPSSGQQTLVTRANGDVATGAALDAGTIYFSGVSSGVWRLYSIAR